MSPRCALVAALLCTFLPASALDISGMVINKNDQPIPLAKVCLRNHPSRCEVTSVQGTFRITDGAAVRPAVRGAGYALQILGSRLALTVPAALEARLEWLDARGRALAPMRSLSLAAGRTWIDLPVLPRDGLHFLRLTVPGYTFAWKAVLVGYAGGDRGQARPLAALSKPSAALTDLVVTKAGFRPETYRPAREVMANAIIVLTAASDSGFRFTSTFTAKNILDRAKGEWVTEAAVDTCNGTTPVKTLVKDTGRFAVKDGKLYTWYEGQCVGELMAGTGDEVVGTWTVVESDVYLPQDVRPAACKDTVLSSLVPPTVNPKLTITDSTQTFEITAEVCPPEISLPLIAYFVLSDTTIEITDNTCRNVAFRSGAGKTATIAYSRRGPDSLAYVFTADTATCGAVENIRGGEGVPIDCSGDDPTLDWLACVARTGFFGPSPGPRPKRSGAPASYDPAPPWRALPRSYALPARGSACAWSGGGTARRADRSRSIFTGYGRFRLPGT